jgi:hypothetical protein
MSSRVLTNHPPMLSSRSNQSQSSNYSARLKDISDEKKMLREKLQETLNLENRIKKL